jgi:hypothetical protein
LAVAYANFMKSAAQRLGPTLIITRPQKMIAYDQDSESGRVHDDVRRNRRPLLGV